MPTWCNSYAGEWITYYYDGVRVIEEQVADYPGCGQVNWSTAATYVYG